MPIIKSAKKRVRTAKKAAIRNSKTKRSLKTAIKLFNTKTTSSSLKAAQSSIDKASKKGVLHPKKASRLKSRSAKKAKLSGVKLGTTTKTKTKTKKTSTPKTK